MNSIRKHWGTVIALIALLVATYSQFSKPGWQTDIGRETPGETIRALMAQQVSGQYIIGAEAAFLAKNSREILRTIEIVEVSESGGYAVVYFKYSIGADIYRETHYLMRLGSNWYPRFGSLKYADNKPDDEEWVKKMLDKIEKWVEGSAESPYK